MIHLDVKRKIQKLVFPEGIILSTQNSQYLTSNVNSLFYLKREFMGTSGDRKKLLTENDDESSLVAEGDEISNLILFEDIFKILEIIES